MIIIITDHQAVLIKKRLLKCSLFHLLLSMLFSLSFCLCVLLLFRI